MDIAFRKLATTAAEIDHLEDLAEQCEVQAKAATMLARRIRAYARQHPEKSALVTIRLREAVDDIGLYACLAGVPGAIVRQSERAPFGSSTTVPP